VRTIVEIDYSKCTSPEECGVCLQVCPSAVFIMYFTDEDFHNPKEWKVEAMFTSLCSHCNLCVKKCPKNAISITVK